MTKWKTMTALDDFGGDCDSDMSRKNIISNLVRISKAKNILVLADV